MKRCGGGSATTCHRQPSNVSPRVQRMQNKCAQGQKQKGEENPDEMGPDRKGTPRNIDEAAVKLARTRKGKG